MVIIDGSGLVIASCSKKFQQAFSSTGIEALVAASTLSFAADIGINKAIMEGDSLVVIKALTKPDIPLSSIGPWIEDAKIYSNSFIQLLYSHTNTMRECNSIAHNLIRYVIDIPDFFV